MIFDGSIDEGDTYFALRARVTDPDGAALSLAQVTNYDLSVFAASDRKNAIWAFANVTSPTAITSALQTDSNKWPIDDTGYNLERYIDTTLTDDSSRTLALEGGNSYYFDFLFDLTAGSLGSKRVTFRVKVKPSSIS